ncbi:MAG TPA: MFS transporter [Bacteroidia bacterium]|jgi:UMF1 family MFS transporter|nr:MFS transporter [Bacteroidia bacterium]
MLIKGDKKTINAWAFYDWANSSYPLVITTAIFPLFYEAHTFMYEHGQKTDMVRMLGIRFHNTELYDYVVALSFLIVSFSTPLLSGIADYTGSKRRFMMFFCYLGSFSCASLYFFNQEHLGLSLMSVLFSSVGFWGSLVFYNAFLPEVAEPADHDRVSAKGFSLGYIGSSILLIMNLIAIKGFNMDPKWSFVSVALWWVGFAQITFARLPNNVYGRKPEGSSILKGFQELRMVWRELKGNIYLKRYLGSFFVYSMGVQTVMIIAVFFANKEIFPEKERGNLIIAVLVIQFVGVLGSVLFSRLSGWIGNIKALGVAIFIWVGICLGTYLWVYTPNAFYIVAALVGLVMGGIQSLSRSTYSKLLPETQDHASYFSFFDVCEKIGIVIGMLSVGLIERVTGSMRNSILALIVFFVVGFILLLTIPKSKATEA